MPRVEARQVLQAFVERHIVPPVDDNVCVGAWEQTGARTFALRHVFWNFDAAGVTLIGRGTILENVTLGRDGAVYSGTFSFVFRDLNGNPFADPALTDVSGQLSAVRITVR